MKSNTKQFGRLGFSMIAVATIMLASTATHASTSALVDYQLGEADSPAYSYGSPGDTTTVDSSGHGFDLTIGGTPAPTYSSNVAPANGSTVSMAFVAADNDAYSRPAPVTSATTNVLIDAWAYPTTTTAIGYVVLNGSGANGYGILQYGSYWAYIYPNITFNLVTPVVPNQWVHLTMLLDSNGDLTGYVNGTALVTQSSVHPLTPTGNFSIGGGFEGEVDDVTVFIPEPASASILVVSGLAMMGRRRRR